MGNELFDIVNPTYLRSLHDIFSDRNKCATAILDERAQPITSESNFCHFCLEIRRTKSGLKLCRESDLKGIYNARKEFEVTSNPKPYFYKCKYGLIDACAPIVIDTKIMGYLMAGQFRCINSEPTLFSTTSPPDEIKPAEPERQTSIKEIYSS